MRTIVELHATIGAICPIDGVSGDLSNKSSIRIDFRPEATPEQRQAAQAVVDAFDPFEEPPVMIPLDVVQARMEAETVDASDAWETYVNYMFGAPARRNAFLKVMFVGRPIPQDNPPFRTTMTGAGISTAAQDRILATPS